MNCFVLFAVIVCIIAMVTVPLRGVNCFLFALLVCTIAMVTVPLRGVNCFLCCVLLLCGEYPRYRPLAGCELFRQNSTVFFGCFSAVWSVFTKSIARIFRKGNLSVENPRKPQRELGREYPVSQAVSRGSHSEARPDACRIWSYCSRCKSHMQGGEYRKYLFPFPKIYAIL